MHGKKGEKGEGIKEEFKKGHIRNLNGKRGSMDKECKEIRE